VLLHLDEAHVPLVKAHGADPQLAVHVPPLALAARLEPPALGDGFVSALPWRGPGGARCAQDARRRGEGEELLVGVDVGDDGEEFLGRVGHELVLAVVPDAALLLEGALARGSGR